MKLIRSLFLVGVFSTLIAIFLTSVRFGDETFLINLVFSQCIGVSIFLCVLTVHHVLRISNPAIQVGAIVLAIIIGSTGGTLLGSIVAGKDVFIAILREHRFFIHIVLIGVLFGAIISYFFISRERIADTEAQIQEERIKRLTSDKDAAEANLRLLQAQIEPHFLFNTLSNILSLLDSDLGKGKSMLVDLIHYLRTSLSKSREETATIGQEIEMIRAYLNIFAVRMEDRLRYRIEVPDTMRGLPFPPMLLQPLVENAVKHGIEPKIEGGEITIRAQKDGDILRVEVVDTGTGFHEDDHRGFGLSNVRERLQSLYGDRGRLIFEENRPSGLKVVIEVPYGTDQGDHRR